MDRSYVVTGGAHGIGRAITERLLEDEDVHVVVLDLVPAPDRPVHPRLTNVMGDAADQSSAEAAADHAEAAAPLAGWVNNAAVLRDASLVDDGPAAVFDLIAVNLGMTLAGASVAVRRFRAAGTPGAIVNLSSHQAQRPVRGALAYATAKAAIEGLTRALAVEHGPDGIRVNAVAPGSVDTERYQRYLERQPDHGAAVEAELARLHPLGRVASAREVAEAVAWLLAPASSFVSGVVVPVDGGRSVLGLDPEAT